MTAKRKVTYEQDRALEYGRSVARANQKRSMAAKAAAAARERERDEQFARTCGAGWHGWKNWEYSDDYRSESRRCRDCGATESRPVRL